MKFLYEYRTPDNKRHKGEVCAADREAAYVSLRKRGINPCRFSEAPGFFNKLFGKGKRWLAIAVLCVLCLALCVTALFLRREARRAMSEARSTLSEFDAMTRRQVIGDAAVVEKGIRTGWSDVFALEGDRFLASFAIPGVPAGQRNTSEAEIVKALESKCEAASADSASLEARQIRAIVEGMKVELREFLSDGGTIAEYGKLLVERQDAEIGYYNRAKGELAAAVKAKVPREEIEAIWEDRNAKLRAMGIRLVPMPEDAGLGQ